MARACSRVSGSAAHAEDAPRRVTTADPQVHPPAADLVERGQGGCRDRRFARPGVRDARPESEPARVLGHERQQRVWLAPQDVRIEQPAVVEAGRLGLAGQGKGSFQGVIGLEREPELHVPTLPPGKWSGSAVLLQTAEPEGW